MSSFFTKLIETPSEKIDKDYVNLNENIIASYSCLINEIYISIVQIVQLTFATKSTRSSDAVNIKFSVVRQIIVDNERNLSM